MASRRLSIMPVSKPEAPLTSVTSRKALAQVMRPPKPPRKIPSKVSDAKTKPKAVPRAGRKPGVPKSVEFVSGESFNFEATASPAGPVTR